MNFKNSCLAVCLLGIVFPSCAQKKNERLRLGLEVAKEELKTALKDSSQHNVVSSVKMLIADSITAVQVAEPILFKIYGKAAIVKERPYEMHFINHYWIINGTLPTGWLGGTFLIILDARDSRIIKLTHYK
ncbi:YbbC/YhhH family protein [Hymenobacter cheonanensis]|uniref:YbbC/YhhH family protein n=1 Tax=Hymenobacter sp. CA2-7 TaxID=3063993 RepID=UPI0027134308|nr:YbbC/YhhH family protein [Hymenobacter sp. CA2-7]MDO7884041.1 YbbC/YhhH family protein [Hymenobacter sp. CA2-7]